MKKILLILIVTAGLTQSSFAAQENPYVIPPPAVFDNDNEKTKIVREGGAAMRGDNQKNYEMPELFEKQKIVMKPRKRSIEQQVWEDYSYPTPRFVTD